MPMFHIALTNQQTALAIDRRRLRRAAGMVLRGEGIQQADLSLAIVDDATIHRLNRQFLQHDWPTDVLSFVLDRADWWLAGEVVLSADTARAAAATYGWRPEDELLLYAVHGVLHLLGYDDTNRAQRAKMRARERFYLSRLGVVAPRAAARGRSRHPRGKEAGA